jgi:hypothetical protein
MAKKGKLMFETNKKHKEKVREKVRGKERKKKGNGAVSQRELALLWPEFSVGI